MKAILTIFEGHNEQLKRNLIDNKPPEAYCSADPDDSNFNKSFNEL